MSYLNLNDTVPFPSSRIYIIGSKASTELSCLAFFLQTLHHGGNIVLKSIEMVNFTLSLTNPLVLLHHHHTSSWLRPRSSSRSASHVSGLSRCIVGFVRSDWAQWTTQAFRVLGHPGSLPSEPPWSTRESVSCNWPLTDFKRLFSSLIDSRSCKLWNIEHPPSKNFARSQRHIESLFIAEGHGEWDD